MRFLHMHRWSGAALMLGSLLFILNKLNELSWTFLTRPIPDLITENDYLVVTLAQVLLVVGWLGYYRQYAPRAGRVGRLGLGGLTGGGLVLAMGHLMVVLLKEVLWPFVVVGVLGLLVGLLVFGSVNLREHVLWRWQALPLLTSMIGCAGFLLVDGTSQPATFLVLRTLFGLGLVGLGYGLWCDTRAVAGGAEPPPSQRIPNTGAVPPANTRLS